MTAPREPPADGPHAIIQYDDHNRVIEARIFLYGGTSIQQSFSCNKPAMAECLAEVAVRLAADYDLPADVIQLQAAKLKGKPEAKKKRSVKK